MNIGGLFERYYRPRKKKCNVAAWIIGAAAFAALVPLAAKCDKKKGEWGIASLLLYVGCKRSTKHEGKKEVTIAIPGFSYVKSMTAEMIGKKRSKLAELKEDVCEVAQEVAEDIEDGIDELLEESCDVNPDVVISEE